MGVARQYRDLDAVLILDKPTGISSNRALQQARKLYQARKAGHCGSLDPLATGVLPVCFGQATKFSSYLLGADKVYLASCHLGSTTTTGDAEGEVLLSRPVEVDRAQILEAMKQFRGEIEQIPPMYSALRHQGKRLYELAREGKEVERQPRQITIFSIELVSFEDGLLDIEVRCSSGTYIRTLAEDIGEVLGCGAHLKNLRRTAVDPFDLEQAVSLEQLSAEAEQDIEMLQAYLLPVATALTQFPSLELDTEQGMDICQGKVVKLLQTSAPGLYRLFVNNDRFIGLGEVKTDACLVAKRLMNTAT